MSDCPAKANQLAKKIYRAYFLVRYQNPSDRQNFSINEKRSLRKTALFLNKFLKFNLFKNNNNNRWKISVTTMNNGSPGQLANTVFAMLALT